MIRFPGASLGANTFTGAQTLPLGAVGAPALAWGTTGLYASALNGNLLVTAAGVLAATFDTSQNTTLAKALTTGDDITANGGGKMIATGLMRAVSGGGLTSGGAFYYAMSSTSTFGIYASVGAPTISASKGSLCLRSDGSGIADRLYVNTNGSTAWTNVVTGG